MLKKKKGVDLKHMFRQGCAFVDCAQACELESNLIKVRTASHFTANMVNSALACEIFLKALLVFHGIKLEELKRIHGLNCLWERYKVLDQQSANKIKEFINSEWFDSKNEQFDRMLNESSRVFVDWRYVYEYKEATINPQFLRGFRRILRDISCQKVYGISWEEFKNIDL